MPYQFDAGLSLPSILPRCVVSDSNRPAPTEENATASRVLAVFPETFSYTRRAARREGSGTAGPNPPNSLWKLLWALSGVNQVVELRSDRLDSLDFALF